MQTLRKLLAPVLLVAIVAAGLGVAASSGGAKAHAQDTWSGHNEDVTTSTIPVTASATAAIITAVTSKRLVVKALVLHSSAAGLFSFHDGSSGTNLGSFYLEANKPFVVPESNLGVGMKTTSGTALHASGTASANLTITGRIQKQ